MVKNVQELTEIVAESVQIELHVATLFFHSTFSADCDFWWALMLEHSMILLTSYREGWLLHAERLQCSP